MLCSLYGIHSRNDNDNLVGEVLELGPSHVTILHHQAWAAKEIHDAIDGYLHIRLYLTAWAKRDPVVWADECANEVLRDRGGWSLMSLGERVVFSAANEMNLRVEGLGPDTWYDDQGAGLQPCYVAMDDWLYRWGWRFRARTECPRERLMWPAVAAGHGEDVFGYALCKRSLAEFGMLGSHPYWFSPDQVSSEYYGRRYVLDHAATGLPVFLSESGNFAITDFDTPRQFVEWFESLYDFPYVLGATPFIRSSPDPGHDSNNWSRAPQLIERIKAQPKRRVDRSITIAPPHNNEGGESMALRDQYPTQFAEWESAGGVEAAFRNHLLGIGALPADKLALLGLAEANSANAVQLANLLAAYPFR